MNFSQQSTEITQYGIFLNHTFNQKSLSWFHGDMRLVKIGKTTVEVMNNTIKTSSHTRCLIIQMNRNRAMLIYQVCNLTWSINILYKQIQGVSSFLQVFVGGDFKGDMYISLLILILFREGKVFLSTV